MDAAGGLTAALEDKTLLLVLSFLRLEERLLSVIMVSTRFLKLCKHRSLHDSLDLRLTCPDVAVDQIIHRWGALPRYLALKGPFVSDDLLFSLAGHEQLLEVSLFAARNITSAGLVFLSELSNLRRLDLSMCSLVEHHGIKSIRGLSKLEHLNLSGCELLGDRSTKYLLWYKRLRWLSLAGCYGITDGSFRFLQSLGEGHIQFLNLRATTLSQRSVDLLRQRLPQATILGPTSHLFAEVVEASSSDDDEEGDGELPLAMNQRITTVEDVVASEEEN